MKRLALAFGAFLVVSGPASSADAPPMTRYTLDNGLEVVLAPDKRVPKVVTNLSYRVGGLNEPPGRSGFAHLFEHLMFSGTEAWPRFDDATSGIGITNNAWTAEDRTLYYMEGLSSTLPVILSIEADRMANLGRSVEQFELDVQRAVVKNEMRQNVIDSPASTGYEMLWSGLWPKGHPYSRAVIGSVADLDQASLDDVRGFFNTYYVPNNAILVVTGDFDPDAARTMIAATLGLVPRGENVPRPATSNTEPTRARIETQDRVPTPIVALGFSGPAVAAEENGPLAIAAEILGNGEYGLLRRRLVNSGLATYAGAYWYSGFLGGRFLLEAYGAPGTDAAALEKELRAGLADFLSKPVDPADVERAKRTLLLAARIGREALKDRAEAVSAATDLLGRPELAFEDDPQLVHATAADVERAARLLLADDRSSLLTVTPGQRGGYPPLLADSTGEGAPFTAPEKVAVAIPVLDPTAEAEAHLPLRETATLSNGIEVVHYRMPEAPVAYVAARAEGGWTNAPAGKEGLLDMASSMAWRGAGDRDFASFAKAAKDIGANIGASSDVRASYVTLSVPPDAFSGGLALLADAVKAPRFDEGEWDILVGETLDTLARREADLPGVADRKAREIVFPQAAGRPGIDWSVAAVEAISLEEAKAAYHRLFTPAKTGFVSVGPMSVDEVKAGLEAAFGTWTSGEAGYEAQAISEATMPETRRVLLLPEPGASQTALLLARAVPGREEAGRAESIAVMRLLGGEFTSRLNSVIREEKGYSYGVYGSIFERPAKGSVMFIETTVQRDTTGAALSEYFKGFDSLATRPVTQEELDRTITAYKLSLAGLAETSGGLFDQVKWFGGAGLMLEDAVEGKREMTGLDLGQVREMALSLAPLDRSLVVVVGDPDVVLPQLAAIGLADVEIIERGDRPSADRDPALAGVPVEPMGGALGSTRSVHGCEGGAC
ncbi:MAG: M16 family metallopeptidase [Rhizobiaceae bacterium]